MRSRGLHGQSGGHLFVSVCELSCWDVRWARRCASLHLLPVRHLLLCIWGVVCFHVRTVPPGEVRRERGRDFCKRLRELPRGHVRINHRTVSVLAVPRRLILCRDRGELVNDLHAVRGGELLVFARLCSVLTVPGCVSLCNSRYSRDFPRLVCAIDVDIEDGIVMSIITIFR